MSADKSQFDIGYQPNVQHQQFPGTENKLDPAPAIEYVPTPDGGYKKYQAANKLQDKKALITGGDSGIGRATAVLFAMEGADVYIAYLPEEQQDADETKKQVEKYGRKCYLYPTNLKERKNCEAVVKDAVEKFGGRIDVLFNNHAYQMMTKDISEVTEEQWLHTFDTNIHRMLPSHNTLPHALTFTDFSQPSSTSPNTPFPTCTKAAQSSTTPA